VAELGEKVIVFGLDVERDIAALDDLVGSATLWAFAVTVCGAGMLDGAL